MLRFAKAPAKPDGFDAYVKDAQTRIAGIIKTSATPKSKDFDDRWGKFKGELFQAQHNKCGYCEMFLATHPGDVEHYQPKAELQELPEDESKWGKEGEGVFNVEGRSPRHVSDGGYWWAAYSWENYLAACNRCNSGWKRNLFPVVEIPRASPLEGKQETPLLLNPFRGEDPADHLEYTKLGQVKALKDSKYGKATIATCGLDRPSLVQARNEKVRTAYELVDEYAEAKTPEERTKVVKRFIKAGSERFIFAGMVRAIFKQKLQLPWEEWEKSFAEDVD
jgi:hypothetical protein